jgi:beta-lactamase regulating signal transducer with metallopeptidase domain
MLAMVMALSATFVAGLPAGVDPAAAPPEIAAEGVTAYLPATAIAGDTRPIATPFVLPTTWVLGSWAAGVFLLSLRLFGGWCLTRRAARQAGIPVGPAVQALAERVRARLGVRRLVQIVESSRVAVPVMIGWLRPIVLVPPAALAGLSPTQLEAILAHEFAHIRRHDYLVNLLQTVVETVLFFHPAVWWLSRGIRRERELCCDDLAVGVCDRLTYATALSALAHLKQPSLALAATDGSLRDRVRRIVNTSTSSESAKGGWMAMLPLMLVVTLAVPSAFTQVAPPPVTAVEAVPTPRTPDTVAAVAPVRTVPQAATERRTVTASRAVAPDVPPQQVDAVLERRLAQADIELRRAALERAIAENEAELILAQRRVELIKVQRDVARLKELVDKRLATSEQLQSMEQEVALAAARLRAAEHDVALKEQSLQLREREIVLERELQRRAREQTEEPRGTALAADATIQPGDLVRIVIEGEPDLPTTYVVQPAGSVRLPLLGSLTVQGLTVTETRVAVERLLASKNITGRRVTVSATRR